MRRMFRFIALVAAAGWAVRWWRRNRRFGTEFMNRVVNPALIRRRWTGSGRSELGMLEHIGRRSGIRRVTLVHPEPTADGFRIVVPLAEESQWAMNVLAAGHCRLQLHDSVYELDEPTLVDPAAVDDLPRVVRRLATYLGFRYLRLHTFASATGSLETPAVPAEPGVKLAAKPAKPRRQRIRLEEPEPAEGDAHAGDLVPAT